MNINLNPGVYTSQYDNNQVSFGKKKKNKQEVKHATPDFQPDSFMDKMKRGFRKTVGGAALAANLAVPGAFIGGTTAMMQSCNIDQTVNIDLDALFDRVDKIVDQLNTIIENGKGQHEDLLQELKNIYLEIKATNGNLDVFRQEVLEALKQHGIKNEELTQKIIDVINSTNIDDQEKLNAVLQEILKHLSSIDDNVALIYAKLSELTEKFTEFAEKYDNNTTTLFNKMDNLYNGIGDISTKLDNLQTQAELNNEYNKQLLDVVNSMSVKLDQIKEQNGGNLTKEDLMEVMDKYDKDYGPKLEQIIELLGISNDKQFTLDELIEKLNGFKTDLSATNEKIQTIIDILPVISQGGITQEQMADLMDLLAQLKDDMNSGNQDLAGKLENGNGKLDELIEIGNELKAYLVTIIDKLDLSLDKEDEAKIATKDYMTQLFEKLEGIQDNQLTEAQMDNLLKKYQTNLTKFENSVDSTNVLLNKIISNQADGGKSMTPEELKAVIKEAVPNYEAILGTIDEHIQELGIAIGDVLNEDKMNQLARLLKIDLSATNEKIQTVIDLVSGIFENSTTGGGSVDVQTLKEISSLASQILQAIKSSDSLRGEENQALQTKLDELIAAMKTSSPTPEPEPAP